MRLFWHLASANLMLALLGNCFFAFGEESENFPSEPSIQDSLWTMAYPVVDSEYAARFCRQTFGMSEIIDSDMDATDTSHVTLSLLSPNKDVRIDFISPTDHMHRQAISDHIHRLRTDIAYFKAWRYTHQALQVDDLDPFLKKLASSNQTLIGPFKEDKDTFHTLVFIPGAGFIEFYSSSKPNAEFLSKARSISDFFETPNRSSKTQKSIKGSLFGGTSGQLFDTTMLSDGRERITKLEVNWDDHIKGISLSYSDNTTISYGMPNGNRSLSIELAAGENIGNMVVCSNKSISKALLKLSYMQISTSSGKVYKAGKPTSDCLWLLLPEGFQIIGFYGRASTSIHALGIVYK